MSKTQKKRLSEIAARLDGQEDRMQQLEEVYQTDAAHVANIRGGMSPRVFGNTRGNFVRGNFTRGNYMRGGYNNPRGGGNIRYDTQYTQQSTLPQQPEYTGMRGGGGYAANMQQNPRYPTSQVYNWRGGANNTQRNFAPRTGITDMQPKRFPAPAFPNRPDLCFYHRMFGREARKHELPCSWVFPLNNK